MNEKNQQFYSPEFRIVSQLMKNKSFEDISPTALQDPQDLIEKIKVLKNKGHSIILDIDFDVFNNPESIQL